MSAPFHSKYYACELTRRWSSDNAEKLSQSINNATIDLNPHQIDAALFAFRSPLSRGALLADEVGLGKTIEAGLIISQLWAERKRRILCIMPAALRQQWERELAEKFLIDSLILESSSCKRMLAEGQANPFDQKDRVILCSFEFARRQTALIQAIPWDLVVLDEAHRLRNVYKTGNKIARAIRDAIDKRPKILLTATPLQNSLMELYGLISFIDPHLFGGDDSFRSQFARKADDASHGEFDALKKRIRPICQRTLRRQVQEYIRYTNRVSLTKDFTPNEEEWRLYETVSSYLQRPRSFALPSGQRALMTLVLRKILASSSFAIAATLDTLIQRLQVKQDNLKPEIQDAAAPEADYEAFTTTQEEWEGDSETSPSIAVDTMKAEERAAIEQELRELEDFKKLAESITRNAKGEALLVALKAGFESAAKLGAQRKALIFTESKRTQMYLKELLSNNGYQGQIITFNGNNNDSDSHAIYQEWLRRHEDQDCVTGSKSADMRSALVEEFKERAQVMIATESGAEGINLQFCNLVVNYDLPWNPQRIEQRIGRCHRYGQRHDVVVINFINRKNAADQRVFELLDQKFKLFEGIFGASDPVLGALDSGVDFERRINDIYQNCRTTEEINAAFDALQQELELQIQSRMENAKTQLLERFDSEVQERLRLSKDGASRQRNRFHFLLWRLTQSELGDCAEFSSDETLEFKLNKLPETIASDQISLGQYALVAGSSQDAHHYRVAHPLAERLIKAARQRTLETQAIRFDYDPSVRKIALIEALLGRSGWLQGRFVTIDSLEPEDHLAFFGIDDDGNSLNPDACSKLFEVSGQSLGPLSVPAEIEKKIEEGMRASVESIKTATENRNKLFFESEIDKLENWSVDLKDGLEAELRELQREITASKREARQALDLDSKLKLHKKAAELERKRNEKRKKIFEAQDQIETRKDELLAKVESRMKLALVEEPMFTIRWEVRDKI